MITYYGYTISPNQLETDEGFLICRNVPIARTGTQDYLASELGMNSDKVVTVIRPEEEVFSDATIASFEGKPVTDDHPSELVDNQTATIYGKGHAQNVRRGSGEWKDYLVADLFIQDESLIEKVQRGKREVSCGYAVDYDDNGDGTYTQRNIRGNHIAIVDEGRAGHKAAIMDSNKVTNEVITERTEKKMSKKSIWSALFAHAAEGKTADEIAKLAMDSAEVLTEETVDEETTPPEPKKEEAKDEDYKDKLFEAIDAFNKRLDAIEARLPKPDTEDEDPVEEALKTIEALAEEKASEEPEEMIDEGINSEEAHVVPAEEMDACGKDACGKDEDKAEETKATDSAFYKNLVSAIRPAIAQIKDVNERKAVVDALAKSLRDKKNDSAKIMDAMSKAKKPASKGIDLEAIQSAYDACNPHLRKENK
jgi:hypothetical protein